MADIVFASKKGEAHGKKELEVTQQAAEKLKEIIISEKKGGYGIRVLVANAGCADMVYSMDFERKSFKGDKVIEVNGLKVYYDEKAAVYLNGVKVDYVTSPQEGFVFRKEEHGHSHGEGHGLGGEEGCCGGSGGSGSCGCGH